MRLRPVGWRYDSVRHSLAAKGIRSYGAYIGFLPEDERRIKHIVNNNPRLKEVIRKSVKNIVAQRERDMLGSSAEWSGGNININVDSMHGDWARPAWDDDKLLRIMKHETMHAAHGRKAPELVQGRFLHPLNNDFVGGGYVLASSQYSEPNMLENQGFSIDINTLMPTEHLAYGSVGNRKDREEEWFLQKVKEDEPDTQPEVLAVVREDIENLKSGLEVAPRLRTFEDVWEVGPSAEQFVVWRKGPWLLRNAPSRRWSAPDDPYRLSAEAEFKGGRGFSDYPVLRPATDKWPSVVTWERPEQIPRYVDVQAKRFLEGRMKPVKTDEQRSELGFKRMFSAGKVRV